MLLTESAIQACRLAALTAMMYLKCDNVHITEQHMPVELQELLQDLEFQGRDGVVVTSSLL